LVSVLTAVDPGARAGVITAFHQHTADRVSVFLPDGSVLGDRAPIDSGVTDAMQGRAFTRNRDTNREVLIPLVAGNGEVLVVQVSVPRDRLRRGVKQAWELLAAVGIALVIIAMALADRLARWSVRPGTALAAPA